MRKAADPAERRDNTVTSADPRRTRVSCPNQIRFALKVSPSSITAESHTREEPRMQIGFFAVGIGPSANPTQNSLPLSPAR
jgi:hypothetical protein